MQKAVKQDSKPNEYKRGSTGVRLVPRLVAIKERKPVLVRATGTCPVFPCAQDSTFNAVH